MTMIAIKDAARNAYFSVAEARERSREQDAEGQRALAREAYEQELTTLKQLLSKHLLFDEDAFEFDAAGGDPQGLVPAKPFARVEDLLFFVQTDEESGAPALMLTFDDGRKFGSQAEVYSLADVGEFLAQHGALDPRTSR